jgi:predicted nucleic acid-binding protein
MKIAEGHFVLDVSLTCAWCFADEASAEAWALLERLQIAQAHVPSLWLWETGNVLIQAERRSRITSAAIRTFLGLLETLPIAIDQANVSTAWHDTLALARSHRLTTYDAAYLELALRLGLPLASRDKALNAAASHEGVPLLPT